MKVNNLKSVFKHLSKNEKTELSQEKYNFGLVQDGVKLARSVNEAVGEMKQSHDSIMRALDDLGRSRQQAEQDVTELSNIIDDIEKINKELGISSDIPEFKQMFEAQDLFDRRDGDYVNNISQKLDSII